LLYRPFSLAGEPIVKLPAGITTISGHVSQSLNVSGAAATAVCVALKRPRNSATTATKRLIAYPLSYDAPDVLKVFCLKLLEYIADLATNRIYLRRSRCLRFGTLPDTNHILDTVVVPDGTDSTGTTERVHVSSCRKEITISLSPLSSRQPSHRLGGNQTTTPDAALVECPLWVKSGHPVP
jgi:hypothetical protein